MPQSDVQTASTVTAIGPVLSPAEPTEITQAGQKAGERVLVDAKEKISSKAVRINTLLQEGDVVQEITRVAKEGHFDLIVMGIRGLGKLKELFVGSVSDGVVRQASLSSSNCEVKLLSFGLA